MVAGVTGYYPFRLDAAYLPVLLYHSLRYSLSEKASRIPREVISHFKAYRRPNGEPVVGIIDRTRHGNCGDTHPH